MIFFFTRVPHITSTHCMLYHFALAAKSLPEKLKNVRTNKGEGLTEPVRKFRGQRGGVNFSRFVQTPLWTTPWP